jgi:hypothetical protein
VARGVDQVELVLAAVLRGVGHPHGIELDRDPTLALEVQGVQDLGLHLSLLEHPRLFDQTVGQGGLSVVDVRDDAEVADVIELHGSGGRKGQNCMQP